MKNIFLAYLVILPLLASVPCPGQTPASALDSPQSVDLIGKGAKIFSLSCMACHGPSLPDGSPMNLRDSSWKHGSSLQEIQNNIKNGIPGTTMMGFGAMLNPSQIEAVAAYVQSLSNQSPK